LESELLRPYQLEGVDFLFMDSSALLADEMGLGKTVQTAIAIERALQNPEVNRILVVAPSSLRLNWEEEIRRWAPMVGVRRVIGTETDRLATYMLPVPVLIASYEQIRQDSVTKLRNATIRRHVIMGAITNDLLKGTLAALSQNERDLLLSTALNQLLPGENSVAGKLSHERFTLTTENEDAASAISKLAGGMESAITGAIQVAFDGRRAR
jgi:hypothetical protein